MAPAKHAAVKPLRERRRTRRFRNPCSRKAQGPLLRRFSTLPGKGTGKISEDCLPTRPSLRRMKAVLHAGCLLHSSEFAPGRIIGSTDPQSLQAGLPVLDDVPTTLGVDAHAVSADKTIHFSIVCRSPLGKQIPFQIANADV